MGKVFPKTSKFSPKGEKEKVNTKAIIESAIDCKTIIYRKKNVKSS